ncbi:zinc-dependent alcohol dehydrogenase family protein [Ciceribacter sp. L1K22]|uniref:zinc-dependent alcohol dehydrogenase family protein n=1 Tax=Ciceribacter sp. L1K22 TaxID=2820275 RepID=UPI001ABEE247|nr:zinc-dependent alcohol dehydrogenase family protein [Ciceribacter sp. L1K22]MBO3760916.1 zinc-dependent alcohol dehydrogenase family protein [Ciceribacter sp. L1K22]
MKAMFYERFGEAPKIATLPDPTPPKAGVVLSITATGLCRSDWHGWMGHDPDINLPHVPGHEFAGVIEAVGPEVKRFKVGDRVTVPFVSGCGHCFECKSGNSQVCEEQFQPGFTHWGSYAELMALDYADHNLVKLPDDIDDATAASLGCRFATSFRAVVDQGRLKGGEWLAVHGCGGVGLSAIMIGKALGAKVVAIDISEEKLAFARSLGATVTINASVETDIPVAVRDATGGGVHVSVDALGHPSTCNHSILNLRRRGRHVQVGLLLAEQARPALPMDRVIAHELEIYGSHGMQAWRYDAMLAMISAGTLQPQKLIGRHISLTEAVSALANMDRFAESGITIIDSFA